MSSVHLPGNTAPLGTKPPITRVSGQWKFIWYLDWGNLVLGYYIALNFKFKLGNVFFALTWTRVPCTAICHAWYTKEFIYSRTFFYCWTGPQIWKPQDITSYCLLKQIVYSKRQLYTNIIFSIALNTGAMTLNYFKYWYPDITRWVYNQQHCCWLSAETPSMSTGNQTSVALSNCCYKLKFCSNIKQLLCANHTKRIARLH